MDKTKSTMKYFLGKNGGIRNQFGIKNGIVVNDLYHLSRTKMKYDGCRFIPKSMIGFAVLTQDEVSRVFSKLKLQSGHQMEIFVTYGNILEDNND